MTLVKQTQNLDELRSLVLAELCDTFKPTLLHAGHYALTVSPPGAVDNLTEDAKQPLAVREIAEFARLTWDVGCEVAASATPGTIQLMTLVNDWQLLKPPADSVREREQIAARLRAEYYRHVPTIPAEFGRRLDHFGLTSEVILKSSQKQWLFSESRLRNKFSQTVDAFLEDTKRAESIGLNKFFSDTGDPIVQANDEDGGDFCLVYCGNTNCAGEFLQLLADLQEHRIERLVNLYPLQCRKPVKAGTSLAKRMFGLNDLEVINIAIHIDPDGRLQTFVDRATD